MQDFVLPNHARRSDDTFLHPNNQFKRYSNRQGKSYHLNSRESRVNLEKRLEMASHFKVSDSKESEELKNTLDAVPPAIEGSLSIDLKHCLDLIMENHVSLIKTNTGTGKSTAIPAVLATNYPDAYIVVAEPRRVAACQLASRVADMLSSELGDRVGYSVRGERAGALGETKVMFVSTYTLLLFFLSHSPDSLRFDYIILDEMHEGGIDSQLICFLLRELMKSKLKSSKVKLVLCSATAVCTDWRKYFEAMDLKFGEYSQCEHKFAVKEVDGIEASKIIGFPYTPKISLDEVQPTDRDDVLFMIYKTLERLSFLMANSAHSIVVFLPGKGEIDRLFKWIEEKFPEKFFPVLWNREVELAVIGEAIMKQIENRNKVYLCTDVAELSVTIPDAVIVIDSCLNKRKRTKLTTICSLLFPPLKMVWISQGNAQQRRGRVGRVRSGVYISMLSTEDQKKVLSASDSREPSSDDLISLVLHLSFLTSDTQTPLALLCNHPDPELVKFCTTRLLDEGFLTTKSGHAFNCFHTKRIYYGHHKDMWMKLLKNILGAEQKSCCVYPTLKGFISAHFPSNITISSLLFYGSLLGITQTAALLGSGCGAMLLFLSSTSHKKEKRDEHAKRISSAMKERVEKLVPGSPALLNDLLANASAVLDFVQIVKGDATDEEVIQWCESNSISRARADEAYGIFCQVADQFTEIIPFSIDVTHEDLKRDAQLLHIISVAAGALQAVSVDRVTEKSGEERKQGNGIFVPFKGAKNDSGPTVCEWADKNVCIPMTLFPAEYIYLGQMTMEVSHMQLFMTVLLLSSNIYYRNITENDVVFKVKIVSRPGEPVYLSCSEETKNEILAVRVLLMFKIAILSKSISSGVLEEKMMEALLEGPDPELIKSYYEYTKQVPERIKEMFFNVSRFPIKLQPKGVNQLWGNEGWTQSLLCDTSPLLAE